MFERVLMVWDVHDGPLTGITLYKGAPHYFTCEFDEAIDDYPDLFELYPVSDDFLKLAQINMETFQKWKKEFHNEHTTLKTHPNYGDKNTEYNRIRRLLDDAFRKLKPLENTFLPEFKALPDQDHRSRWDNLSAVWTPRRVEI
ncbi:hypothetical protein [Kiloniella sp.]|uniref:hypothetical protein n=1 Tax=Kiloniella sp. TaxID=1938587 RepID=UPI003B020F36